MRHLLMVCTGNICRSPMAEGVLRQLLRLEAPAANYQVQSAGTAAVIGYPADPLACQAVAEHSVDISAHRARQVINDTLQWADLVLTMQAQHNEELHARFPQARGKVYLLGHWSGFEVPDPVGGDLDDFRHALGLINNGLDEWVSRLGKL